VPLAETVVSLAERFDADPTDQSVLERAIT
jgi:hypothetical protein